MRCPNCQTENPRGAKFCLECGNRLLVCPNCGTVNLPVAKFCIECGTSLRTLDPRATQPTLPAVQAPGIDQPGLPQPEERRVVTIMFADITGSTPLADRLDPEDMRAILAGYFNLMTEQIRKHGGTVEKYIGDAVMAVFGVPLTHEDDPDRAIRAALDMQAALAQFNQQRQQQDTEATRLQMRIGINTGEVAAAPGSRQDFLITGDAVNVAARLQQTAAPDTILIGERTYLTTREVFDFRAIAPLHLKGKNEAIHAWVVLGLHKSTTIITQHPRGIEGLRAPLVGRRLELAMMHATYARVQNERHPHLITLLGLPGIGKTRLVREFIAREKEAAKSASATKSPVFPHVLQGRCPPYGEGITYWPLVEILRSIIGTEDTADNDTIQRLFIDFVVDTLTEAKSNEDPLQIAAAIARSVGSGLGGQINDPLYTDRLEREHQRSIHNKNRNIEQSGPRTALQRAWRVLLEALAQKHPLILVIDDLQWADEALLDLLEYLTDRITDVPILFICPARPEFIERRREWGGGQRNFTTINLESLSSSESSELVDALLHTDDLPGVLRQTILARAEGNPFFVEEIVRMLIDQGVLIYKNGCWYIGSQTGALFSELANPATHPVDNLIDQHYAFPLPQVPDTIQGVLAARIDLLNKVEKNVLQHAAIISRSFWLSALLELASGLSKEAIVQALDSLIERDFIVETERKGRSPIEDDRVFSFKHVLIRDVVYNNTPRTRRSYEHAQLALWLEKVTAGHSDTYVELLAYHYQHAFNTWSASLLTNALASRGSGTVYRANSAARLTRPELRRRAIHYLTRAGDLALHSYYTIRAIQAYGEALDLLSNSSPDPLTLSRMHRKLGNAYAQRANADEAWQEYVQSLKLRIESLSQEPDEEELNGLLRLYERLAELGTRWLGWFDKPPSVQEVRTYIDEGLKLLEGRTPGRSHVAFLTYQALWYILQCNASPGRRAELVDQALRSGQEGYRIAEEIQDVPSLWLTLDALGYIYRKHHRYQEALKAQERRLELAPQIESREELHDLYASLGRIYTSVSNYAAAAHWFGQAWNIAQTMESPSMLLDSMNGRMFAWYYWNHWQDANEVAQRMLQMTEQYQQNEIWKLDALNILACGSYSTGEQEQGDSYTRLYKRLLDQQADTLSATDQIATMRGIYLAREDWSHATHEYTQLVQNSEPFPKPTTLSTLTELIVMTGEQPENQPALCERASKLAKESGARHAYAIARRASGRMHLDRQNWEQAEQDLKEALAESESLDLVWDQGQAHYCLGLLYRRRAEMLFKDQATERNAEISRARFQFEQAIGFFESLKAVRDAQRVRRAIAQDSKAPV